VADVISLDAHRAQRIADADVVPSEVFRVEDLELGQFAWADDPADVEKYQRDARYVVHRYLLVGSLP
jgi:hypothetical protein